MRDRWRHESSVSDSQRSIPRLAASNVLTEAGRLLHNGLVSFDRGYLTGSAAWYYFTISAGWCLRSF